jgi:hypothetical protein
LVLEEKYTTVEVNAYTMQKGFSTEINVDFYVKKYHFGTVTKKSFIIGVSKRNLCCSDIFLDKFT